MGIVKKIGQEYYIEFEARGLKYQQKAGTDKQKAQRLLEEVENKIAQGQMGTMVRDVDVDIFFTNFHEDATLRHTRKTIQRFKELAAHFQHFLKGEHPKVNKLSQITPVVLEQYKIYLQKKTRWPGRPANKAKIINLSFFLLWEIFQYAIKLGYLNDNPSLHVELLKIPLSSRPRPLSEAEIKVLSQKSVPSLKIIIEFILLTGVRWSEAAQIRWQDVDQNKGSINILSRLSMGRTIPLTLEIKAIFNSLKESLEIKNPVIFADSSGRPFSTQSLCLQFRELLYNCGLTKKVTLDCLRHTFAVGLLKRRVPLTDLYKYLGLSDVGRAIIYAPFIEARKNELYGVDESRHGK